MSETIPRRPRRNGLITIVTAIATAAGVAAAVALTTAPASAIPEEDVPPIGTDSGRIALPIHCEITTPDLGDAKIYDLYTHVTIEGVAPTVLGPGQQFFLTQGRGSMTFPKELTSLAGLFGIDRADATIKEMNIGATNASPDVYNIAEDPIELKDIPISPGEDLTVEVPEDGSTFPDIGPFTAPDRGTVTLRFDGALVFVKMKSKWGYTINLKADCKPVAGNALLTKAVGGPAGQPPAAFHGAPMNYPKDIEPNTQFGIINAEYFCTAPGFGKKFRAGVAVGAYTPLSVSRGGSIEFTEASSAIVLPPETVNQMMDLGFEKGSATTRELNIMAEGGSPKVVNVGDGFEIPEQTLVRDKQHVISVPNDGSTLTAGPWRPDAGSSNVRLTLGTAGVDFTVDGISEPISVTCAAPDPEVILLDAPVTE